MMETSVHYARLERAVAKVKDLLEGLHPHFVKSDLDALKLRSFVLLCHAAFEEYLEKASLTALEDSVKLFKDDRIVNDILHSAISYYPCGLDDYVTHRVSGFIISDDYCRMAERCLALHQKAILGVHGVKTGDQDTILNPLGVRLHSYNHVLSQSLDSFGTLRGGYAHLYGIKQILPKVAVLQQVDYIQNNLLSFDGFLLGKVGVHSVFA